MAKETPASVIKEIIADYRTVRNLHTWHLDQIEKRLIEKLGTEQPSRKLEDYRKYLPDGHPDKPTTYDYLNPVKGARGL
jgi:hypothetical protein